MIAWLWVTRELGVKKLRCNNNSQVVICQVQRSYEVKEPSLLKNYHMVQNLVEHFEEFKINHVPWEENDKSNVLFKLVSIKKPDKHWRLIQQTLSNPSWDCKDILEIFNGTSSWMIPIFSHLTTDKLPVDLAKAKWIRQKTSFYIVRNGKLFTRGFVLSLFKWLV